MGTVQVCKVIFSIAFSFLILFNPKSYATETVEEKLQLEIQEWAKVSMAPGNVEAILKPANCHHSALYMNGCISAISAVLEQKSKDKLLIRFKTFPLMPYHGKVIQTFGSIEVRELIEDKQPTVTKPKEFYELFKSAQDRYQKFAEDAIAKKVTVPIDDLREYLFGDVLPAEKNFYVSILMNAFYQNALDSHYGLFLTKNFEEKFVGLRAEFNGIGAILFGGKSFPEVGQVLNNSPAKEAGLKKNDLIIEVDNISVKEKTPTEVADLLRGPIDTLVKVKVQRGEEIFEREIPRRPFKFENIMTSIEKTQKGDSVLNIKIEDFMEAGLCSKFTSLIRDTILKTEIKGVVVDLRNNKGGSLSSVLCMAAAFLRDGTKLMSYWSTQTNTFESESSFINGNIIRKSSAASIVEGEGPQIFNVRDPNNKTPHLVELMNDKKLVVLVNGNSASASEVFSGIVQDYGVGAVVGQTTYGKGCVQAAREIDENASFKVTVSRFHLPSGRSNQKLGIEPDYAVYASEEDRSYEQYILKEKDLSPLSPEGVTAPGKLNKKIKESLATCKSLAQAKNIVDQDKIDSGSEDQQLTHAVEAVNCN